MLCGQLLTKMWDLLQDKRKGKQTVFSLRESLVVEKLRVVVERSWTGTAFRNLESVLVIFGPTRHIIFEMYLVYVY